MNATILKTDRIANRAPKGGAVSGVNGRFYKGGQFMPCVSQPLELKPAPLVGSVRQVAWATRLRAEKLAQAETRLVELRAGLETVARGFRPFFQTEVQKVAVQFHRLLTETSAVAVINTARA